MIILVAGSDTWRVEQDVARLRAHFVEKFDPTLMNVTEGAVAEHKNELLTAAKSFPFLSEKRLVIVRDILGEETELEHILDIAQNLAPSTILVLISKKSSEGIRAFEGQLGAIENVSVKAHYYDAQSQLSTVDIQEVIAHYGLRLSQSQAQELTQVPGNNKMTHIHTLLAALKDAVEDGIVPDAMWRSFFPRQSEQRAFDFVDALMSKDLLRGYTLCEELIGSGAELIPTWSMVYTQLRKYYALSVAGDTFSAVAGDMGISFFEQNKIRKVLRDPGTAYVASVFETYTACEKQGKKSNEEMKRIFLNLTDIMLLS